MNYNLPDIPFRSEKPREKGLTMVMDKGLSLREAEDLMASASEYIDLVKLGFGTSLLTVELEKKLAVYKAAGVKTYFGGTLFEAFIARNMFDDFRRYLDKYAMEFVEVSDGVITMEEDDKCEYISLLSNGFTVLSEVGYKTEKVMEASEWVYKIKQEQAAGAWKVITEARESGKFGIFDKNGNADEKLIKTITEAVDPGSLIWEAPLKSEQVWFIQLLGAEVNLGNIATNEVIPLETLRRGLRGDTLLDFLGK